MKFSEKLTELRHSRGWSQEQLGERLGVTRQTVSKWELGSTTPELEKLAMMSDIFGVSTDELIKGEPQEASRPSEPAEAIQDTKPLRSRLHFEYKSRRTVRGLPLVHINFGAGRYTAKGIFALGNKAVGVVAGGFLSVGVVSFGLISAGLLALGTFSVGALAAGVIAFGGAAAGWLAFGGSACGMYAVGGAADASHISCGGYSTSAHVAIGDVVRGAVEVSESAPAAEVRELIMKELPETPGFIADMFSGMAEMMSH
ncbi:MAG: helix-turn-helix domain-containing protein [Oscillospiraceae bacterium]